MHFIDMMHFIDLMQFIDLMHFIDLMQFIDLMHFINWMLWTYSFTYTYTCDSYLFFRYLSDFRNINLYLYLRNRYADMDRYDYSYYRRQKFRSKYTNKNEKHTKYMNFWKLLRDASCYLFDIVVSFLATFWSGLH